MKFINRLISAAAALAMGLGAFAAMPVSAVSTAAVMSVSASAASASTLSTAALFEKCGDDYGYNYLAKCTNGTAQQSLYKSVYDKYLSLWTDTSDIAGKDYPTISGGKVTYYISSTVSYKSLGLTLDQATAVFFTVKNDNPLMYYIPTTMTFDSAAGNVYITVAKDYATYSARKAYQTRLLEYIDDMTDKVSGSTTDAMKTIMLHDLLISKMEYCYDALSGNITDYEWAHNVIGALDGSGVCECYARTYQLLMNYSGLECLVVVGKSYTENENTATDPTDYDSSDHAWNVIKLDGKYYFTDATWDDHNDTHRFFAKSEATFTSTLPAHGAYTPSGTGTQFLYGLPSIATADYDLTNIDDNIANYNYTINDDDTVTITGCNLKSSSVINIPEKIAGFTVSGIGDYAFYAFSSLKTLTMPGTVKSIGQAAFAGCTALTSVTLSDSLETIGADAFFLDYSLKSIQLPSSLKTIGEGAFFHSLMSGAVTIPSSVTKIGSYAIGYRANVSKISYSNDQNYSALSPVVISGFTITCYNFSAAESYAVNNSIKRNVITHTHSYVYVMTVEPTLEAGGYDLYRCSCGEEIKKNEVPALRYLPGDVNGDKNISMGDLTRLQQYLAAWGVEIDEDAADVTGDGKIAMNDLTRLQQYLAAWNVELVYKAV